MAWYNFERLQKQSVVKNCRCFSQVYFYNAEPNKMSNQIAFNSIDKHHVNSANNQSEFTKLDQIVKSTSVITATVSQATPTVNAPAFIAAEETGLEIAVNSMKNPSEQHPNTTSLHIQNITENDDPSSSKQDNAGQRCSSMSGLLSQLTKLHRATLLEKARKKRKVQKYYKRFNRHLSNLSADEEIVSQVFRSMVRRANQMAVIRRMSQLQEEAKARCNTQAASQPQTWSNTLIPFPSLLSPSTRLSLFTIEPMSFEDDIVKSTNDVNASPKPHVTHDTSAMSCFQRLWFKFSESVVLRFLKNPCALGSGSGIKSEFRSGSGMRNTELPQTVDELEAKKLKCDERLAKTMFTINMVLLVAKLIASALSGSLSVISSCVDSAVDLASSIIVWMCARKIKHHNPYKFPRGRSRLEPLAIIMVAVIRGASSVVVIVESIRSIAEARMHADVSAPTISIMAIAVIVKLVLTFICYAFYHTPNSQLFGLDNRNDCISNFVAIVCAYIGERYWAYADPIGAILVMAYIIITWYVQGREQAAIISGRSASPEFINRILKVTVDHHPCIKYVTRLTVYHYAIRFLVELDIVVDANLTIETANQIVAALRAKIERLPYVERAFVCAEAEAAPSCDENRTTSCPDIILPLRCFNTPRQSSGTITGSGSLEMVTVEEKDGEQRKLSVPCMMSNKRSRFLSLV